MADNAESDGLSEWVAGQVKEYAGLLTRYQRLAQVLELVLRHAADQVTPSALSSFQRLASAMSAEPGAEWAGRLLLLAMAARFGNHDALGQARALASTGAPPLTSPVVMVAGGTAAEVAEHMASYHGLLGRALTGYAGTVISGGTTQGICGIIGQIGHAADGAIRTVGYLPRHLPTGVVADQRYTELRRTGGDGFSPLEPLQAWTDLIAAGINPAGVRALGVGGGQIAAAEYRIALALGATLGLVDGSGREAARLLDDARWAGARSLRLPADGETLRAFLAR